MKELIEVLKKNYVVYSTHSIFMIDSNKIDRHYIVKKADENTVLHEANKSNFQDEEVLFKALGFSSFELLKSCNLLFEGWKAALSRWFRTGIRLSFLRFFRQALLF
jgi:hypothetical protein